MDEHNVPTLAMDEFDWILSRTSGGELFARTKLHPVVPPPLKLVRMLLCLSTHSRLGEGLAIPFRCYQRMFVHIVRGSKISN